METQRRDLASSIPTPLAAVISLRVCMISANTAQRVPHWCLTAIKGRFSCFSPQKTTFLSRNPLVPEDPSLSWAREGSVPRSVGAVPELWVPLGREKDLMAVGEKLGAPVSAPIPWLCKMPGFASSQLFRGLWQYLPLLPVHTG